ncbi:hypothetical protein RB595_000082 [Gaeumannomyces hyphopodioides]
MAVSRELAFEWECGHCTDLTFSFPDEVTKAFIEARTKPWEVRLKNYWAWYHEKDEPVLLSPQDKLDMQRHLSRTFSIEPRVRDGFFVGRLKRLIGNQRLESERKRRIGTEFHGFTSLSAEIRTMIYGYALVSPTGKFVMPPKRGGKFEKILKSHITYTADRFTECSTQGALRQMELQTPLALGLLLCVSKAVQSEAEAVFFGENMILFLNSSPAASADDSEWWVHSLSRVGPALRSVGIAIISSNIWEFNPFGGDIDDEFFWDNNLESLRAQLKDWDGTDRADFLRDYAHVSTIDRSAIFDALVDGFPNLNLLELCLKDGTCLPGCCREGDFGCVGNIQSLRNCRSLKVIKCLVFDGTEERTIKEAFGKSKDFIFYGDSDHIRVERCVMGK